MPFKLDSLAGLPRYVFPSLFQSVCDVSLASIMSSSLQKAAPILVLYGVAGILPLTPFL